MFLFWGKLQAQEIKVSKSIPNELVLQKEFINKIDSLFVHQQYGAIIEECNKEQPRYNKQTADYNLIAAYYFIGAKEKSLALLENKIASYATAFSITDILMGDYTGYRHFVEVPEIKKYLMNTIYEKLEEENITDTENATILLKLVLDDQLTRNNAKMYTKVLSQTRFPYEHLIDDSTTMFNVDQIRKRVLDFYKKTGKIFSKEDVGSLYSSQFVLFFHEGDLDRREFYLSLIQEGVKNEVLSLKQEINFRIATEMLLMGDISKYPSPEIIEKYRKQYNMPDYYYIFL